MITNLTAEIYQSILCPEGINVHFQPIVSISRRSMVGFESLLKASYKGELLSPESLFSYSREQDSVITLDTLCQTAALSQYHQYSQSRLLFINVETSLLEYYLDNVSHIIHAIDELGIPRGKIVIEINEKEADSDLNLLTLISVYRNAGFLIALDDVGAGHSNLNRIVLARPDIVKIDRSVIMQIHQNYYKQEVLHSIAALCQKIGAVTIAEGTEEMAEVITCVSCGVDWFQGYFFSRAIHPEYIKPLDFHSQCQSVSEKYQQMAIREMFCLSSLIEKRKQIFQGLLEQIQPETLSTLEKDLTIYMISIEEIECVYVIGEDGVQLTETLFHPNSTFRNQDLFSPMKKGDCHISRPFYNYALHHRQKTYISDQYISFASGNFCQTISKLLSLEGFPDMILCVDFGVARI